MRTRTMAFAAFSCMMCCAAIAAAQEIEIKVAAAADLQFALRDLAAQYEKQSRAKLSLSFGSSGNFFAQILNGAPFDVFFSADNEYPRMLEEAALTEPGTRTIYAQGRIVLWAPPEVSVDFAKDGLSALLDPTIQKIAIANPEHAPYGRAAEEVLRKGGLYDRLHSKLVIGENISQAAQFVQSGNAQAGVIALSLALSPAMKDGQRWEVPLDLYTPLQQSVVVLKSSANKAAALAFLKYLHSGEAEALLARYGFSLPAASAATGSPKKS
jgi:molybdate transport system substrate-binding protein